MTPEQAQTKWCPFVRHTVGPPGLVTTNRGDVIRQMGMAAHKCIGPDCMAWRWDEPLRTTEKTWTYFLGGKPSLYQRQEYDAVTETTATVLVEVKTGYCGLAGKEGAQ